MSHASLIAAIDLWVTPKLETLDQQLYWQRVLHFLALWFIPFSISYLCLITRTFKRNLIRGLFFVSFVQCGMFFTAPMLGISGSKVVGGLLYKALFFPYVLAYIVAASYLILFRFRQSPAAERKIQRQAPVTARRAEPGRMKPTRPSQFLATLTCPLPRSARRRSGSPSRTAAA